jgi:hypothetical protein
MLFVLLTNTLPPDGQTNCVVRLTHEIAWNAPPVWSRSVFAWPGAVPPTVAMILRVLVER